jgi:Xaa-Pro aminopeptidase
MLTNLPRLHELMKRENLDGVIGTCPESVTYLSGFWAMSQWVRRGPQAYVLQPGAGQEACIITNSGLLDLISDQDIWVKDIRRYGFFQIDVDETAQLDGTDKLQKSLFELPAYKGPVEALVAAIKDKGFAKGTLGIDELGITPQCMEQLRSELPDVKWVRCFNLLERVRASKTPEEVGRLRRAAAIAEGSINAALSIAAEGISEREMLRAFNAYTVEQDAGPVTGCIGFGNRSAMSNVQASDRKLKRGDLIRFDVGGRYRHYRSDISRIASFGEPSAKVRKYHQALEKGVQRAYDILKPGLKAAELFTAVVETVRGEGIPHFNRSHVGHGIGIDGYDPPNIAGNSTDVFEENMVVCIETPYYELGFAGLQVEDMIHVTKDGAESLMTLGTGLRVIQ